MQTPTEQVDTNWIKMRNIIKFIESVNAFNLFFFNSCLIYYCLFVSNLYYYFRDCIFKTQDIEYLNPENLKKYFEQDHKINGILNSLYDYSDDFKNDVKQYHFDNLIYYSEATEEQKERILELMLLYLYKEIQFRENNAEKTIKYIPHYYFFVRQEVSCINLHIENNIRFCENELRRNISYYISESFEIVKLYSRYTTVMYFFPEYFTSQIAPDEDIQSFCLAMDSIFDEKQLNIIRPLIKINVESDEYRNLPQNTQNIIVQLQNQKFRNDLINYWNSLKDVDLDQAKKTTEDKKL